MCGICGVYGYTGRMEEYEESVARMSGMLAHRGPDDSGRYGDGLVLLAHRRLSIIDVEGGAQPMSNEDGSVWIVYNGEVYNFRELRSELVEKGHRFRTSSDTEVVVHLYEEYGLDAVKRLNGMFAFGLWDAGKARLVLARDRVGVKPLYYHDCPDGLYFSSELRSLVAGIGGRPVINRASLCRYLLLQYVPAPATILDGMQKLPPGHMLTADREGSEVVRYWSPEGCTEVGDGAPGPTDIRRLLDFAVERQMVSDVPVGAFLSGGIDSSAVVALMRPHVEGPLKTFSIGFEGPSAYDETTFARAVAKKLGTEHHETKFSAGDFVRLMPDVIRAMDEPVADPAALPVYRLSALAREHVKVVMTGEGGDELFGGYLRYLVEAKAGGTAAGRLAGTVAGWLVSNRRYTKAARALSSKRWPEAHVNWVSVFLREELEALAPEYCGDAWEGTVSYFGGSVQSGRDRLCNMILCDMASWISEDLFAKVDRMSMAVSLEARVPYLDYPLMDAALSLGRRDRIRGMTTKYALKEAVRGLLPADIIDRKKKGFDLPLCAWFRGQLRGYVRDGLAGGGHGAFSGLDRSYIDRMLSENESGKRDWALPLFSVLVLKLWTESMGV